MNFLSICFTKCKSCAVIGLVVLLDGCVQYYFRDNNGKPTLREDLPELQIPNEIVNI